MSSEFEVKIGFFSAGDDIMRGLMTVADAERKCKEIPACIGFTFKHGLEPSMVLTTDGMLSPQFLSALEGKEFTIFFKHEGATVIAADSWFSWSQRANSRVAEPSCAEDYGDVDRLQGDDAAAMPRHSLTVDGRTYQMDIFREEPLVALVHDFVTAEECEYMIREATPHLYPAQVRWPVVCECVLAVLMGCVVTHFVCFLCRCLEVVRMRVRHRRTGRPCPRTCTLTTLRTMV